MNGYEIKKISNSSLRYRFLGHFMLEDDIPKNDCDFYIALVCQLAKCAIVYLSFFSLAAFSFYVIGSTIGWLFACITSYAWLDHTTSPLFWLGSHVGIVCLVLVMSLGLLVLVGMMIDMFVCSKLFSTVTSYKKRLCTPIEFNS